jgi:cytochrome c biogenesis protein CcdA
MLSNVPETRRFHNYGPWINVVLGLLVFVLRYDSPPGTFAVHWNLFLTGLVIMFAALGATIAHDGNPSQNYWSAIDIVAGVWLLVSLKVIPSVPRVTVLQAGLGALVIAVALVSLAIEFSQAEKEKSGTKLSA